MNGILSEKSKSLAFTGHRIIPVERQDEIRRMCQNDASSFSLYNHRFAIFHRV